jgi:hypothetical protein
MADFKSGPPLVIYNVQIVDSNRTNWYSGMSERTFEAVLDIVHSPFKGQKIMFKTIQWTTELRFIELHHAQVLSQRIAEPKDYIK